MKKPRTSRLLTLVIVLLSFVLVAATPATKDDCKKGGWQTLTDDAGDGFKNQGQCVSWVNHNAGGTTSNTPPVAFDSTETCTDDQPFCQDENSGDLNNFADDADNDVLTFQIIEIGNAALAGTDLATAQLDLGGSLTLDPVTGVWSAFCGQFTTTGFNGFTWVANDGTDNSNPAVQRVSCFV